MTHTYNHPDAKGLGSHHADPNDPLLQDRPAQPPEALAPMSAMLDTINATDEQRSEFEKFSNRSMHDLDMHHGTEVNHVGTDEDRGLEIVEWTDANGDHRATSVTPEFFASHFTEKEE